VHPWTEAVCPLFLHLHIAALHAFAGSDDFGGSSGGSLFPSELQLQRAPAPAAAAPAALAFADEPMGLTLPPVALGLKSQSQIDAEKAKSAVLPPLQSVLELTTAFRPPERCVTVVTRGCDGCGVHWCSDWGVCLKQLHLQCGVCSVVQGGEAHCSSCGGCDCWLVNARHSASSHKRNSMPRISSAYPNSGCSFIMTCV
jgi:hypothetical protein